MEFEAASFVYKMSWHGAEKKCFKMENETKYTYKWHVFGLWNKLQYMFKLPHFQILKNEVAQ